MVPLSIHARGYGTAYRMFIVCVSIGADQHCLPHCHKQPDASCYYFTLPRDLNERGGSTNTTTLCYFSRYDHPTAYTSHYIFTSMSSRDDRVQTLFPPHTAKGLPYQLDATHTHSSHGLNQSIGSGVYRTEGLEVAAIVSAYVQLR